MNIRKESPSLSIVIPCHNEEEVIYDSCQTIQSIIEGWEDQFISDYEIVLVNNGSTDHTLNKMLSIYDEFDCVVIVDLRKNFGYQGSISAGLRYAKYDMVVSIDADLQDDPKKIYEMIVEYKKGFDMVLGVRKGRLSDGFLKRTTAHLYYSLLSLLGIRSVYNHADFRLLARSLVDDLNLLTENNRYLRSLVLELEGEYSKVYYDRRKRDKGRSKFKSRQLVSLAVDGITSFTSAPIRIVTLTGLSMFMIALGIGVYVSYLKMFGYADDVPGWAFLAGLFSLFGGIQCLSIGVIGEYISKIYIEVKNRPLYTVRKIYNK